MVWPIERWSGKNKRQVEGRVGGSAYVFIVSISGNHHCLHFPAATCNCSSPSIYGAPHRRLGRIIIPEWPTASVLVFG
jgi:hypothetical protein